MWQQRAYFEQSNVLDVTIQCQVNMASKNVAEFSTLYSPPAQTPANYCQQPQSAFSSCARAHQDSTQLPVLNSVDSVTPVKHPEMDNTHYYSGATFLDGFNFPVNSTKYGSHPARTNMQLLDFDQYSSCMNDSGYGSPNASFHHQQGYSSASPDVVHSRARESVDRHVAQQARDFGYTSPSENSQCSYDRTFVHHEESERLNSCVQEDRHSGGVDSTDAQTEEMKLAMRERDVAQRLFTLRARDSDLANELESYYQSQTSMVDLERHNVLCQMAYDKSSSDSINKYYNRKLLTVLEFVENKLAKFEKCAKSKTMKRSVTSPKKSRLLPKHAVKLLESWYQENLENPYPSREVTLSMASEGSITVEQIRKWFANKRNRSRNNKMKAGLGKDCE